MNITAHAQGPHTPELGVFCQDTAALVLFGHTSHVKSRPVFEHAHVW